MARPLRIEYEGALYHITTRGNERKPIFKDDTDREIFIDTLHKTNNKYNWICHTYCLMDNHYHLVIETPDGNLSKGMRQLNGVYTQTFNKRHNRIGHIFQGRYKAILIQKESHLLEVCRYVVLNPIRAKTIKRIEDWKWSSYCATAGKSKPHPCLTTDWILRQFAQKKLIAEKKYREFVQAGTGDKGIWEEVKGQSILGREDFVEKLIGYIKEHKDIKEIPKSQRYINRPALKEILNKGMLLNKKDRNKRIKEAINEYGYSHKEIADYLGLYYTTISRIVNDK
ncbi:MAG: transposase [Thermodesulfovibrionales bacterium]|nr:transposase [Thermodesulfovibrionales bacterium]